MPSYIESLFHSFHMHRWQSDLSHLDINKDCRSYFSVRISVGLGQTHHELPSLFSYRWIYTDILVYTFAILALKRSYQTYYDRSRWNDNKHMHSLVQSLGQKLLRALWIPHLHFTPAFQTRFIFNLSRRNLCSYTGCFTSKWPNFDIVFYSFTWTSWIEKCFLFEM